MASAKKSKAAAAAPKAPQVPDNFVTHRPGASGGPACPPRERGGVIPTDARAYINIYDPEAMPTCTWCANYHQAVARTTGAMMPWTKEG